MNKEPATPPTFTKEEKHLLAEKAYKALEAFNTALDDCSKAGLNPVLQSNMPAPGEAAKLEMTLKEVIYYPASACNEPKSTQE